MIVMTLIVPMLRRNGDISRCSSTTAAYGGEQSDKSRLGESVATPFVEFLGPVAFQIARLEKRLLYFTAPKYDYSSLRQRNIL